MTSSDAFILSSGSTSVLELQMFHPPLLHVYPSVQLATELLQLRPRPVTQLPLTQLQQLLPTRLQQLPLIRLQFIRLKRPLHILPKPPHLTQHHRPLGAWKPFHRQSMSRRHLHATASVGAHVQIPATAGFHASAM